jgi:glycosyltransferase involved in cell wall biosynthesis
MATVVHMTSVHSPDDPRIFAKECRTLSAAGYDVHLVAPTGDDEVHDGVRVWSVPPPESDRRLARMTSTVMQVYRRARSIDADLYHFHDPELMPAALALAGAGKPVIYDVHEDLAAATLDKAWLRPRLRGPVARVIARLEPAAANQLAAVVAATPAIAERFSGRANVVTVNNFPALSEFADASPPSAGKEPAVCYVGAITAIRGIDTMLEAIAATDARLLLAGHFDPPSLAELVPASPRPSQVESFGEVERSRVAEIFDRAMAGVVLFKPAANHFRAQPTKLFEYMSAGLPVIASNFPLWCEIVERNKCGICVDPLSPAAVAEAIRWLIAHPDEAREMGENGREVVRTTYNWEPEGRKLIALYRSLLG